MNSNAADLKPSCRNPFPLLSFAQQMSTVTEIEAAIEKLPPEKKYQLREWVIEHIPTKEDEDILVPASYRRKILDGLDQP